jgi:hypothetical protein
MSSSYDEIFKGVQDAAKRLIAGGETDLARVVGGIERDGLPETDVTFTRYGHVIGDQIHRITTISPLVMTSLHRLLIKDWLIRSIPADCDQIIELGGGWGSNLFHLWLGGGPQAEYISLEPSRVGREISETLAALAPKMRFRALDVDIVDMDFATYATGRKVFVLSCYTLALVRELPGDIFRRLLQPAGVIGGVLVEPGAWQAQPTSAINDRARAYANRHGRNENMFQLLESAHAERILRVTDVMPNYHAPNPAEPLSVIRWARSEAAYCQIGQAINFSSSGTSGRIRKFGWSDTEDWGCWTDGPEAALHLALDEIPSGDTTLAIDIAHAHIHSGSLHVSVSGNGLPLADWPVSGAGTKHVTIPRTAWLPFGILDLSFKFANARSPMELKHSADQRQLGIGVSAITIKPGAATLKPSGASWFRR